MSHNSYTLYTFISYRYFITWMENLLAYQGNTDCQDNILNTFILRTVEVQMIIYMVTHV